MNRPQTAALQVHEGGEGEPRRRPNMTLSAAGALQLASTDEIASFARMAMVSGLYPATRDNDVGVQVTKIQFVILYGLELGLTPMQSLQGVVLVDGKLSVMANTISMLLDRHRDRVRYRSVKWTNDVATIEWKLDGEVIGESSFSLDDAKRAGLTSKGVWAKYPKAMLWARALTQGARAYASFVFGGNVYTPEELGDDEAARYVGGDNDDAGERRPQPHRNQGGSDKLRAAATKKAAVEEKIVDAEVSEPAMAKAEPKVTEPVVVPEPEGAAPPDDVPVVQVAQPEVLPPVEGAEFSGALKAALGATPPIEKRTIAGMGAWLKEWMGKLERNEAAHLKLWARAMNNEVQGKPLDAGLPDGSAATLERLGRAKP